MTAEAKIRQLASADTTLQADLGTAPFRWFDVQLPQNAFSHGTCVRIRRVSTRRAYNQGGLIPLDRILFQIDVIAADPEVARSVASHITTFFGGVNLCSSGQFDSPVISPNQAPCFLVNQRSDMEYQLHPPAYVQTMDWRIANSEIVPAV